MTTRLLGDLIDESISDPFLRNITWGADISVFIDKPHLALYFKWQRLAYLQTH